MKNIIKSIIFFLVLTVPATAQENRPFSAVENLFAAMSAYDYDAMFAAGTDDFQLLEHGEVWDMRQLADAIRGAEGVVERRNFYSIIKEVDNGSSVWISYWNRADFRSPDGGGSAAWLESVVVVEQDGKWVLQMMHSTGLDGAENLPEGLEMEEYVGRNQFLIQD